MSDEPEADAFTGMNFATIENYMLKFGDQLDQLTTVASTRSVSYLLVLIFI